MGIDLRGKLNVRGFEYPEGQGEAEETDVVEVIPQGQDQLGGHQFPRVG